MRIALYTIFVSANLFAGFVTTAQDIDFPDYRSKKDNFSKINDKDVRNDLASFVMAGLDESIGKAQLKSLGIKEYNSNFMTFEENNIQVTIKVGVFFPTKHKMMYSEKHLVRIDGKPYYGGNYGEPPKSTIDAITVV